ncbi:MAG: GGDEF domain-containing protein, partial [Cohaesibacteraceae bacterium]
SRLFPRTNGELYIYSNSRDVLDLVSSWGETMCGPHLHADQCWGLRRGRAYAYGTSEIDFACDHVGSENHPYFCLPIIAHGDTIGLLHISFPDLIAVRDESEAMAETLSQQLEVALICAEQISLAAANVRLQAELQDQSVKDALTGLWNRRWFLDMASREIRRAEAAKTDLSLAMVDVDHFKKFNDAHGHDAGDTVLKVLAAYMSELDGTGFYPCRIGGEEFAILFSGYTPQAAEAVIDDLRSRLAEAQIIHSGKALPGVTISVGITKLKGGESLENMMRSAEEALYAAKNAGRDCTIIDLCIVGQKKAS